MATKTYPLIAREGWLRLGVIAAVATTLSVTLGMGAGLPVWLVFGAVMWMFRDPTREPPSLPLAIVSPIHGRVTSVATGDDPYLERPAEVIEIRTGLFDIRSIYAPTEGKIMRQWQARQDRAERKTPDTLAFWVQTDEQDDIVLEIVRRGLPGPIHFRNNPGERVGQGRRVGYVNNGCVARVYLPTGSLAEVEPGQSVRAAADELASLVHLTALAEESDSGDDEEQSAAAPAAD